MGARRIMAWFDPCGRLSRRAYGRRLIRLVLLAMAQLCAAIVFAAQSWRAGAFAAVCGIAALWLASLAQTIRRLHDRGRTGWWLALPLALVALSFVPVETQADAHPVAVIAYALATLTASLWFCVETLGRRGVTGPNRHGPPPSED